MSYGPFQPQDVHLALRSAGAAYGSCGHPRQLDLRGGALPCATPWCGGQGETYVVRWSEPASTLGEVLGGAAMALRPRELAYRREQIQTTEGLKFLWRKP